MYLVDDDVGEGDERGIVAQLLQQHARRAVEEPRVLAHLRLEANGVADHTTGLAAALRGDSLCERDGRDSARLGDHNLARATLPLAARLLE